MLISVQPDSSTSDLMAAGYTRLPSGTFLPIHFQGAVRQFSGELAGFYSGLESELLLWNLSAEDADVKGLALPKFIRPPVVSLANGKTKQLVPLDAQCNDLPRFPDGTTFQTKKSTGASGSTVATVTSSGLLTGKATPGLVFAEVTLPNGSILNGCSTGSQPIVQVGPMTIYLRFLAGYRYLYEGAFPWAGACT